MEKARKEYIQIKDIQILIQKTIAVVYIHLELMPPLKDLKTLVLLKQSNDFRILALKVINLIDAIP